jgi:membrane protein YdbS with pleckstrin-like domain
LARSEQKSRATSKPDDRPAFAPGDDWVVRRPGPRERRWFLIHALIRGLYWLIPFVVVALLWAFWFEVSFTDPVPLGCLVLGLLILLFYLVWGTVYPRKWMVAIGPRDVMIERGILWVTRVFISFDRVQQIDKVSTPVMSRLDLTELVLHSAAGGVRIYALDPADAELITDRVRANEPLVPLLHR